MKRLINGLILLLICGTVYADDISNLDRFLCASSEITVCIEGEECVSVLPWEIGVPQFVVVDIKKKQISTTKASGENRSTPIQTIKREGSVIFLQGVEQGRAFSYVIDKATGLVTVSVSRDGVTVSVFGACTDADI